MNESLYIFNPDTDLALADGSENYIPPRPIQKMMQDLALLPNWYKDSGERIIPWGWNPALVKHLKSIGIEKHLLPDEFQIERIKQLSHRSHAIYVQKQLISSKLYCFSAIELRTITDIELFTGEYPSTILKAPWSGSGKGLLFCTGKLSGLHTAWCKNILNKQHSIIGEIQYDKVQDFAMEFYSNGIGKVNFSGYSMFYTDKRGAYKSNLLDSDLNIENTLSNYIPVDQLRQLRDELEKILASTIQTDYQGYLGVDMMVCRFEEQPFYRLHPCVEINLRMNMGMVARIIYDRHLAYGSSGIFRIGYAATPQELYKNHQEKCDKYPLQKDNNGKIISGYLALTPVLDDTNYCAYINCTKTV